MVEKFVAVMSRFTAPLMAGVVISVVKVGAVLRVTAPVPVVLDQTMAEPLD